MERPEDEMQDQQTQSETEHGTGDLVTDGSEIETKPGVPEDFTDAPLAQGGGLIEPTPAADAGDTDDAAAQPPEVEEVETAEVEEKPADEPAPTLASDLEGADVNAASYQRNLARQAKLDRES